VGNLEIWLAQDNVKRIIALGFILLCVFTLLFFIKRAINKKITNTDHRYRTRKVANLLGYVLFIASIMFVYNNKLGGVVVALGVIGAGVAFVLQEVITSIAGWLSILMSDAVKVGNRLKIGNIKGDIIDIGVLKTTLMEIGDWLDGDLYNGRIVTIANSFVFKESAHNYSGEFPFLWDEIKIPIRTEGDFKLAGKIFDQV
jgi:small-conductance mechanosensitive channel